MALRLGSELVRLWLILSVLWIGGVTATTWWTLPVYLCAAPPGGWRDEMAKAAAPYVHPRLQAIEHEMDWLRKPMIQMTDEQLMAIASGAAGTEH
jgi:hypothetical protein